MTAVPWRIAMASSIGTSHAAAKQPCQDVHFQAELIDSTGQPVLLLAVADGAGSAAVAEVGASIACQTFGQLVGEYVVAGGEVRRISRALVCRWLAGVAFRVGERAKADGREPADYACTLLAAIVGEKAAAFVQVGDGAIVISQVPAVAGWRHVFWPQHGEFANTTNFVTAQNVHEVVDFALTSDPVAEVAIFTDGIENLVLQKVERQAHAPFFDSMFRAVRRSTANGVDRGLCTHLETYLSGAPVNARTDDDKTLILASRRQ
jgi:hypothetical protein